MDADEVVEEADGGVGGDGEGWDDLLFTEEAVKAATVSTKTITE